MAVAFFTVFFVGGAFAVSGSPSNFESQDALNNANPPVPDGNMTVDTTGNSDWNCFANGGATDTSGFVKSGITVGTGTPAATCNTNLVKANALAKSDPAATTSDDSWVNGTKFDNSCEPLGTNKNPGKDDFTAIASYNETKSSNNHTFLYGATIRYTANGSASENLELNQVKGTSSCPITRTAGDHLLAFDYNSGGKVLNLHVLTWIDSTHSTLGGNNGICIIKTDSMPCWGANVITPADASFDGDTNVSAIDAGKNGINGQALVAGQFAEFGVDLTSALNQDPNACNTTSQIDWESRSSGSSFSSNPEDIAITTHPISNCGQIIIRKVTSPSPDVAGTSFSYTDNIDSTGTFSLKDGGSKDFGSSVLQGSYTVTEDTSATPGYTLTGIDCSASTKTNGSTASGSTSTGVTTISLKPGDVIDCTYTNTLNTATLSTAASSTGTVTPGTSVTDTATVTGSTSTSPTGTVNFRLCGPLQSASLCSSGGTSLGTGTLSGSGGTATATSTSVNTGNGLSPGFYCFGASWSGDGTYPGGASSTSSTGECFTVSKINTSTVTTPNDGSGTTEHTITLGSTIYDTAVVTGNSVGGDPTGFVVFHECGPIATGNCSTNGTLLGSSSGVALVSDGVSTTFTSSATSDGFKPTATGRYCFRGDYLGSTVYNASSDPSNTTATNECFTVTDTTGSTSAQTWLPNDTGTVTATNGATLTGTLSIQLYSNADCGASEQGGGAVSGQLYSKSVSGVTTDSKTTNNTTYTVSTSSSVSWLVTFTSTDGNVTGSSHCEVSSLTITN
jgi:Bacterial Ig-like domain (group 3)